MVEKVVEISRTTAEEVEGVSAAAEEQASSMSQVSSNVESLTEQAEQLQSHLSKFEVGGAGSGPGTAGPASTPDVVMGDGGTEGETRDGDVGERDHQVDAANGDSFEDGGRPD